MASSSDVKYEKVGNDNDAQDGGNPDPISIFKSMMGGGNNNQKNSNNSSESGVGLKPSDGIRALQASYAQMTDEQKAEAEAHAERMKAIVEEKLARMTPEERAVYEKKHALMTKAVMTQLEHDKQEQPQLLDHLKKQEEEEKEAKRKEEEEKQRRIDSGEERDRQILFAIRSGQINVLEELLTEHGKDVNFHAKAPNDSEAHPLLHWASLNDQKEVINYLLDKNVDLDQRNPRGEVALHWASLNGNLRAVHQLIENGCDRTATDARGYSAMHHGAQFGRTIVLACLHRRGLPIDIRDHNGRTPLHWAAYKGEDFCAQWLIDHGASIFAEDFERCMPIHWAALQGLPSTCTTLMKNGAIKCLDSKDRTGGTPISLARDKQQKYAQNSYQYSSFGRVANYLEKSKEKGKDINPGHSRMKNHQTWYLWPILAPIGFWQYYTVIWPETFFYPITTLLFVVFYWAEWVAWLMLQTKDPGAYVIPLNRNAKTDDDKTKEQKDLEQQMNNGGDEFCVTRLNPKFKMNPGAKYREMYTEVLDKGLLVPVCTTCEIVKPLRSKHDKFTDTCIAKFDHFCPFMGVAVGENNYQVFFFAMFNAMIAMFSWCYLVILYTYQYNKGQTFWQNFWETLYWQAYAWLYLPIALYAALMVGQHFFFIKKNLTTNEMLNKHRYKYLANKQNPYSRGSMKNFMEFFGLVDPIKIDIRNYYRYLFDGNSEQVDRINRELAALKNPDNEQKVEQQKLLQEQQRLRQQQQQQQRGSKCNHNHSGSHGHSHGWGS